ncbi:MAG: glycosyltransferase family 4 protein [Cyanobacteria bacterium SIG29]|nr:glycosyltransferase family 4 protein [Cyanobacteria bacterium SIG29]
MLNSCSNSKSDKKILYVFAGEFPWEVRIEKFLSSLSKVYNVAILTGNTQNRQTEEIYNDIQIFRYANNFTNTVIKFLLYFFTWGYAIYKYTKKYKPDIVILREIPLLLPAIIVTKIFKIKLVVDVAENMPELLKSYASNSKNFFLKMVYCYLPIYTFIESQLKSADKILVVVEESKQRLVDSYSIDSSKIEIISNYPYLINLKQKEERYKDDTFRITYTGNIDSDFRGIQTVVDAAKILQSNESIQFNIIGDGNFLDFCKQKAQNLLNINFLGKYNHDELLEYLKTQDIGIVPHTKSPVIEYTIPNKIFDYMASSIPVIVSSARPLKRIVEEADCGYVFEAENPQDLANVITYIYNHQEELKDKAINGYNSIKSFYNWEETERTLLDTIKNVI